MVNLSKEYGQQGRDRKKGYVNIDKRGSASKKKKMERGLVTNTEDVDTYV